MRARPTSARRSRQLLARGPVLVHVDARRAEVSVPPRFRADPSLVLRFGYTLSPAIADLDVDDDAISGTLTFGGQPFHCVLPWTAVYAAMVEGEQRGTVWPEDVPEDVLTGGGETPAPVPPTVRTRRARPPCPRQGGRRRRSRAQAREPPEARRVTMRALLLAALAACGTPAGRALPLSGQHEELPAIARSTPAPAIAWARIAVRVAGLPAIARDRSLAVVAVVDSDGGRGFPNLRIEIRDRSDRVIDKRQILESNDFEQLAPDGKPNAELEHRIPGCEQAPGRPPRAPRSPADHAALARRPSGERAAPDHGEHERRPRGRMDRAARDCPPRRTDVRRRRWNVVAAQGRQALPDVRAVQRTPRSSAASPRRRR